MIGRTRLVIGVLYKIQIYQILLGVLLCFLLLEGTQQRNTYPSLQECAAFSWWHPRRWVMTNLHHLCLLLLFSFFQREWNKKFNQKKEQMFLEMYEDGETLPYLSDVQLSYPMNRVVFLNDRDASAPWTADKMTRRLKGKGIQFSREAHGCNESYVYNAP